MTTAAAPNAASATATVIAGCPAARVAIELGSRRVWLWTVGDLERRVDRGALLRGDVEPPYWAHLWSGARVLARYLGTRMPVDGRDVLEIGCGLGLPGVAAAALGGRVTMVDACAEPLQFVTASAAANRTACTTLHGDFLCLDATVQCDVLLAAEVAYDRDRFPELAAVFDRHLRPRGIGLMADGYRTDTRPLYRALAARGLGTHAVDVAVTDEGRPAAVRLTWIHRRA